MNHIGDTITATCPMGIRREVTVEQVTERSVLVGYPLPRGKGVRRFWVERGGVSEPALTSDEKLAIAAVYMTATRPSTPQQHRPFPTVEAGGVSCVHLHPVNVALAPIMVSHKRTRRECGEGHTVDS